MPTPSPSKLRLFLQPSNLPGTIHCHCRTALFTEHCSTDTIHVHYSPVTVATTDFSLPRNPSRKTGALIPLVVRKRQPTATKGSGFSKKPKGSGFSKKPKEVASQRSQSIEDQVAEKLVAICPVKVFDIEDIGKAGKKRATIACALCRERREGKGWDNAISLQSKKDHFICK
ncbi:hypothetical protein L3X38_034165 [Prunus dulcis]|uniref:Uncharacterized protein n=1 Tax=Prunus dulcis TaxID=3755 RepID=A0AAD4VID4_PRUDU|nr:hypothetical protein L3X38_034165 [Prunus dulcis]